MEEAHTTSNFQRAVLRIGNHLIVLAVALGILILGAAPFQDSVVLNHLAAQDQALALFHWELGSLRVKTHQHRV